jgi:hypothetical protein
MDAPSFPPHGKLDVAWPYPPEVSYINIIFETKAIRSSSLTPKITYHPVYLFEGNTIANPLVAPMPK